MADHKTQFETIPRKDVWNSEIRLGPPEESQGDKNVSSHNFDSNCKIMTKRENDWNFIPVQERP